jgi:hypothetical protein
MRANTLILLRFESIPHAYQPECDLRGWVCDHERATEPAIEYGSLQFAGSATKREVYDIGMHLTRHTFQIHRSQCQQCLAAVACTLRAWQDVALLEIAAALDPVFIWQRAIPRNWSVWWTRGKGFQQPLRSPCDEPI